MKLRNLDHSDVKVTPLAFGAWAIGGWMWGGADEQDALRAIRAAVDHGMTTIDTAPVYGLGKSEELIAQALHGVPRDQYQILTKYGLNWETDEGELFFEDPKMPLKMYKFASKKRVKQECEKSLRRLRTDVIDLYQIHWPDPTTPIAETMEAVADLQEEGKIRAAGVCNYSADQVREARETVNIASDQVPYSMVKRDIENELIPYAVEGDLSILAYSPLQRGLLTGKFTRDRTFNPGDSRNDSRHFTLENIDRVQSFLKHLRPITESHKATIAQVALAWTLCQKGITCVLAGARNEKQVAENIRAAEITLSNEEVRTITARLDEAHLSE